MKSNRVLQMSAYYLKNNTDMSTVLILNFKYDSKAPYLVYKQDHAIENEVGLDKLNEDLESLLTPSCKWVALDITKISNMNTQIGKLIRCTS